MQLTHVCHGKLTLESLNNVLEKSGRGGGQNNVIYIEQ
jgi:hypothetical protein